MANLGVDPVQVIAVTGGKGGVGKTNVSANLALALADLGNRVALLDADLSLANLNLLLGHESERSLADVISGRLSLSEVVQEGRGGVRVVPGCAGDCALGQLSAMQLAELIHAFSEIGDSLDYLIIDTASGIGETVLNFAGAAREVLVVACDEPMSIASASALIRLLHQRYGTHRFHVLANKVASLYEGYSVFKKLAKSCEHLPDISLCSAGAVQFDHFVPMAAHRGRAVYEAYPRSKSARDYQMLAQRVALWPLPSSPNGRVEFFVDRLVAWETERVRRSPFRPAADLRRLERHTTMGPRLRGCREFG